MQGLVPRVGRGMRLQPRTDHRSKGRLEVDGRPLLAHGLDTLRPDVQEFVVIGYMGARIWDSFGDRYRERPIR